MRPLALAAVFTLFSVHSFPGLVLARLSIVASAEHHLQSEDRLYLSQPIFKVSNSREVNVAFHSHDPASPREEPIVETLSLSPTSSTFNLKDVNAAPSPIASTLRTDTSTSISLTDDPVATNTTSSLVPAATQSASSTAVDIDTIRMRRLIFIVGSVTDASSISSWLSTLQADGSWPVSEIDYTSGCDAQRANWPARGHWLRLVTMTSAFHGGLEDATQWVNNSVLLSAISLAMDFWFSNDMPNVNCLDSGVRDACPCGTLGFWNTNWFSNIIGIPQLVAQSCLLVNSNLTLTQFSNCTNIAGRAYATFNRQIVNVGTLTGANTLDVASIGIDLGLLEANASLIGDAYTRVHDEVVVKQNVRADGIRPDGSFGQHGGLIYNGNYGKDYANDVFVLEIAASDTQFEANTTSREAFETLIDGDEWMIYRNVETGVLHWDFSVLGRFISFPVADEQATASIKINTTQLEVLGEQWKSSTLVDAFDKLSTNTTTANVGHLNGHRMFYNNDYMVQRGPGYVTTLRMYSSRTRNTECTNLQNPFGFHLSDGTVYTYLTGSEYEDIAAAWDWNLIPGTTVDYNATILTCEDTGFAGVESFVGGASTGSIGIGAMRYTNPLTASLHWQKAWFFLEGGAQHVMINNLSSATNAPVFSVLDQRRHTTNIFVDLKPVANGNFSRVSTLWHGNVGYSFPTNPAVSLNVDSGPRKGNWSALGISQQPPPTVDLFAAWLAHAESESCISYTMFPAVAYHDFLWRASKTSIIDVQNDAKISAILDAAHSTAMIAFWAPEGGEVTVPAQFPEHASISVSANKGLLVILEMTTWNLTVSDPTQSAAEVQVVLRFGPSKGWTGEKVKTVSIILPSNGSAGRSVSIPLF